MICVCCGGKEFIQHSVLWAELVAAWELSDEEAAYVERQQGLHCADCHCSLRVQALALAILQAFRHDGPFIDFVDSSRASGLRVLEINSAGALTPMLRRLPRHCLVEYPAADMMNLPFENATFDLVIHSDTLEHVADPVAGLRECRRVLDVAGACAYTVPTIVGRLSRSRYGLAPSYHGNREERGDYLVHTEYGADAWTQAIAAGFLDCRIVVREFPAALAYVASGMALGSSQ